MIKSSLRPPTVRRQPAAMSDRWPTGNRASRITGVGRPTGTGRSGRQLWARQAGALLSARDRITADDPALAVPARTLQQRRLLPGWQISALRQPPQRSRQQIQDSALGDYPTRRDQTVQAQWQALRWRARRRTDPADLAAAHDTEHLTVCDTCAILTPKGQWEQPFDDRCRYCGGGQRLDYSHHDQVATLTDRLTQIRALLRR
jgi:hypothetical protein